MTFNDDTREWRDRITSTRATARVRPYYDMFSRRSLPILLALLLSILAYICLSTVMQQPAVYAAYAHAYVIGSDPVDGSTINAVPAVVRIFFNATISPISVAHVYYIENQTESLVDVGAAQSAVAKNDLHELDIPLKKPAAQFQGGYEVKWTAVSNDDGHTTYGLIGFNVGYSSTGLPGVPLLGPTSSNFLNEIRTLDFIGILSVAWEWLVLVALTFWVGILVTERLVVAGIEGTSQLLERAKKRALPLQWLCLAALLVGEVVTLLLRATHLSGILSNSIDLGMLLGLLTQTNYGHLWLARTALFVIALCSLWWASRLSHPQSTMLIRGRTQRMTRSGPLRWGAPSEFHATAATSTPKEEIEPEDTPSLPASQQRSTWRLLLAGLILLTYALSGDVAQVAQLHGSAVVFDWLYLAAQCTWFGGLAYLGYVLLALLPVAELDSHTQTLLTFLRHLTPFMLGSMGVLLASGLFLSEASVGNAQQLLTDPYGRALLVRILLTLMILLLSFYVLEMARSKLARQALLLPVVDAELPARRTRQSALEQTQRSLKQVVGAQSLLAAGVLLCTALMAFYAPPIVYPNITYSNPPAPAASTINAQTKQVGDLSVMMQMLPGRIASVNTVIVIMTDPSGKPVTDAQVRLSVNMETMDMGTAHASVKGGNPTYVATFGKSQAFSMAGLWDIALSIQRPGQAPAQTMFQVMLAG